ncbi:hypothetical protein R3P38DRAFT_2837183 [Favolaschia claudopus]|uniref:Uncharacterized protein n=1 Tax=Favolaschia claudopus TaxID=2862362 RepID=A0AAW0E2Y8_9AGAR
MAPQTVTRHLHNGTELIFRFDDDDERLCIANTQSPHLGPIADFTKITVTKKGEKRRIYKRCGYHQQQRKMYARGNRTKKKEKLSAANAVPEGSSICANGEWHTRPLADFFNPRNPDKPFSTCKTCRVRQLAWLNNRDPDFPESFACVMCQRHYPPEHFLVPTDLTRRYALCERCNGRTYSVHDNIDYNMETERICSTGHIRPAADFERPGQPDWPFYQCVACRARRQTYEDTRRAELEAACGPGEHSCYKCLKNRPAADFDVVAADGQINNTCIACREFARVSSLQHLGVASKPGPGKTYMSLGQLKDHLVAMQEKLLGIA